MRRWRAILWALLAAVLSIAAVRLYRTTQYACRHAYESYWRRAHPEDDPRVESCAWRESHSLTCVLKRRVAGADRTELVPVRCPFVAPETP